jgi:hypothetical protein
MTGLGAQQIAEPQTAARQSTCRLDERVALFATTQIHTSRTGRRSSGGGPQRLKGLWGLFTVPVNVGGDEL